MLPSQPSYFQELVPKYTPRSARFLSLGASRADCGGGSSETSILALLAVDAAEPAFVLPGTGSEIHAPFGQVPELGSQPGGLRGRFVRDVDLSALGCRCCRASLRTSRNWFRNTRPVRPGS